MRNFSVTTLVKSFSLKLLEIKPGITQTKPYLPYFRVVAGCFFFFFNIISETSKNVD